MQDPRLRHRQVTDARAEFHAQQDERGWYGHAPAEKYMAKSSCRGDTKIVDDRADFYLART